MIIRVSRIDTKIVKVAIVRDFILSYSFSVCEFIIPSLSTSYNNDFVYLSRFLD